MIGCISHAWTMSPFIRAAAALVPPQRGQACPVPNANGQVVGPWVAGFQRRKAAISTGRNAGQSVRTLLRLNIGSEEGEDDLPEYGKH